MSKLLKSKFFWGILVVAGLAVALSTSAAYFHTVTLRMGMSHPQVMVLQQTLNANGYLVASAGAGSPGLETSYFGPRTQQAVKAFQAGRGLVADGIVGPITGAALATLSGVPTPPPSQALCPNGNTVASNCALPPGGGVALCPNGNTVASNCAVPPGGTTPPPSGLQGGAGSVEDYTLLSRYNNEEVGEDEEDVKVAGLEIEVDDGSDLEFMAVQLVFNQGTADNDDLDEYISEVTLWLDGKEVARVDADRFHEDNNYTRTIPLDSGAICNRGDTCELVVAVTGVGNLDSGDEGETWTVDFRQIRFRDAQGTVISEDPGTAARTFSVEFFATAADAELRVSLTDDEDEINEAHVINIDDTSDTDNVPVLAFTLTVRGNSDLLVDDIPINFDSVGVNLEDAVSSVSLLMDGDEVGSENMPNGAGTDETIVFNDLDLDLKAGKEYEFIVRVDLNSLADGIANGDTISAQLSATERGNIDVEDESGEELALGDRTGTAIGEAHALYDEGIMLTFVSSSQQITSAADEAGESDTGQFKVTFRATAFDADMRIDRSCEADDADAPGQGVEYDLTISAADTAGWSISCILSSSSSDTEDTANTFEVDEGSNRTFTLTVIVTPDEDSFVEMSVASVNWGTAQNDTNANYYTFNLDNMKTDAVFLNDM